MAKKMSVVYTVEVSPDTRQLLNDVKDVLRAIPPARGEKAPGPDEYADDNVLNIILGEFLEVDKQIKKEQKAKIKAEAKSKSATKSTARSKTKSVK